MSAKPESIFFEGGREVGILMIHGYTGTTDDLAPFAKRLHQEGYTVSLPLLRGHGRSMRDLGKANSRQWIEDMQSEYQALQKKCDRVSLIGLSMGASLSFILAAQNSKIQGVIAMAAPYWIRSAAFTRFLNLCSRFQIWDIFPLSHVPKKYISRQKPPSTDRFYYDAYPFKSVKQLLQMIHLSTLSLPGVHCPVLLMYSTHDPIVPFDSLHEISSRLPRNPQALQFSQPDHVLPCGADGPEVIQSAIDFIASHIEMPSSQEVHHV